MSGAPSRFTPKPTQLRLLVEIAEQGQVQLAAEQLGMTQPAASRMLGEMERQIGAALFLRQPRGMVATEIGQAMLRRARAILREMASMGSDLRLMREGLGGAVRIGAVTGPAVSSLVAAIRAVKAEAPAADISVEVMPSSELLRELQAGEMDFVLGRILPETDSRAFNILPMRDERVRFLVRGAHPLARAASVTLTELLEYEWIMQQRGAPIREATMTAFANLGLSEPANVVNSPSFLFTMAYLAQGDAIAPLSHEVEQLLRNPPISAGFAALAVPHDIRVSRYYLLELRRRPLSPLAERLKRLVLAHARE